MKRIVISFSILLLALGCTASAQDRQFTIESLLKVRRVSDPQVSPRGDMVAFSITNIDMEANKGVTQIYLVSLAGGEPRPFTSDGRPASSPRWSANGDRLAFVRDDQI